MQKLKFIFCIVVCLVFFFLSASFVFAIDFTPQIGIGNGFETGKAVSITGNSIANYIIAIYKYAITAIGIIATIVLMIGGVRWLVAGGSPEAVNDAKAWIKASLSGLVLMLCSYLLLAMINTNLTEFKPIQIQEIGVMPNICCNPSTGQVPASESKTKEKISYNCPENSTQCANDEECNQMIVGNSKGGNYSCVKRALNGLDRIKAGEECIKQSTATMTCMYQSVADCKTANSWCRTIFKGEKFISETCSESNNAGKGYNVNYYTCCCGKK